MPLFNDHPYTSITVKIDQLSKPHQNDEVDNTLELYVSDLLHLIKLQPGSGASEAARAIRKRIKYGDTTEEQLRALNILELLILNSGSKIGPIIARDDKLLDVLKGVINGSGKTGVGLSFDEQIQQRAKELAVGWKSELDGLDGYKYMQGLWKNIPRKKHSRTASRSQRDTYEEDTFADSEGIRSPSPSSPAMRRNNKTFDSGEGSSRGHRRAPPRPISPSPYSTPKPSKSKSKSKTTKRSKKKNRHGIAYADEQYRIPQINYKIEAPNIRNTIAETSTHTTTLQNLLITLSPGESPLDNSKIQKEFEKCKSIRRKVLKYLQFVGVGDPSEKKPETLALDDEFLGSLIVANESLVEAFKRYDFLAGYTVDNPAPDYDEESDESYYTSESDTENYDDEIDSITDELHQSTISPPVKSPPPRPVKPAALTQPKPSLVKTETNASVSSDPFGDGNEFAESRYL